MPLRWHEWVNVGLVVVFGQGLQIVLITVALVLVLLLFGVLLFPPGAPDRLGRRPDRRHRDDDRCWAGS